MPETRPTFIKQDCPLVQRPVVQAACFALLCGLNGFLFTVLFCGAMFSAGRATMLFCGGFAGVGLTLLCIRNQIRSARLRAQNHFPRRDDRPASIQSKDLPSSGSRNICSIAWPGVFSGASMVAYDAGLLLGISQNKLLIPALFLGAVITALLVITQKQLKS